MKANIKTRGLAINLILSVAISLIVNFSYFVMMILSSSIAGAQGGKPRYNPAEFPGFLTLEIVYYIVLAFILLVILTAKVNENKINSGSYWKRLLLCVAITVVVYFFAPHLRRSSGEISILMLSKHFVNPMVMLKVLFTFAVAALYGKIYELLYQKQNMILENERLRNENLQSRYDVLVNQINPHFLFNSLNSLSMLVREEKTDGALMYIDRLSDTFRYILETGRRNMTTVEEELRFVNDYKFLFEVRYEGKFFLEIDVDSRYYDWCMPSLSLQPLIENAVKHNTITKARPLKIYIASEGENIVVSNMITPKIAPETSTGIGLRNISSRYSLLTGKEITVTDDGKTFSVKLPLIQR